MRIKTGWIVLMLLSSIALLGAQTKIAVGLALGGSYNVHTGSNLQKTGTGFGFAGGGQLDISFTKSLGLLTTIYAYDNRIGNYIHTMTQGGLDYSADVTVTIAYAAVEPLLKYTMPDKRFYLVVGPYIGYKVDGRSEIITTILTPGYSFSNGFSYVTTSSDLQDVNLRFELAFGGGYAFAIDPTSRLTAQLTAGYGLNDIEKNVNWRINSIRLIAGLEFDLGR
jgi:hypothetical protein